MSARCCLLVASVVLVASTLACLPPENATPDAGSTDSGAGDASSQDAAAAQVTGSACETFDDCGDGFDCYTLAPDGYCMPGAPGGPDSCVEPDHPCPEGTVCSPIPRHAISGVCMLPCDSDADCRGSYVCDIVELWPGDPNSPASPEPVCWTVCEPGVDHSCNDDPIISSILGTCLADGTCSCGGTSTLDPETGRCI